MKAAEQKRGCGYRKVGGLYLVGSGLATLCDLLPLELVECPFCGYIPPFTRGYAWIRKAYIQWHADQHHQYFSIEQEIGVSNKKCVCSQGCPICHPEGQKMDQYGLMWVGTKDYTPESFIAEAQKMTVSKRIAAIPKDLILGKTWVLLAYSKFPFHRKSTKPQVKKGLLPHEPEHKPAVFYAFIPQRVEMPIYQKDATKKKLKQLKEQGITPVIIPDKADAHKPKPRKKP